MRRPWWWTRLGYALRPYDLLTDRRRWFWQPRQRCGLGAPRRQYVVPTRLMLAFVAPALFFSALGWVLVACGVDGAINMAAGAAGAGLLIAGLFGLLNLLGGKVW